MPVTGNSFSSTSGPGTERSVSGIPRDESRNAVLKTPRNGMFVNPGFIGQAKLSSLGVSEFNSGKGVS